MENIEKIIEEIKLELNEKLELLKKLEQEKIDIMARYQKATSSIERQKIEKEMKISEQKFKKLNDSMLELSKKVKELNI